MSVAYGRNPEGQLSGVQRSVEAALPGVDAALRALSANGIFTGAQTTSLLLAGAHLTLALRQPEAAREYALLAAEASDEATDRAVALQRAAQLSQEIGESELAAEL